MKGFLRKCSDFWGEYLCFGKESTEQKRIGENRFVDRPQKATPAKNADIFKTPWVLHLRTEVPEITITADSMTGLKKKLRDYYQKAKVITNYLPDRTYLIRCDGSMHAIDGDTDEITRVSVYPQIAASLDFGELPYAATVEGRIARSRQKSLLYGNAREREYVFLGVHAHVTITTPKPSEPECRPVFAARNGTIIVARL